MQMAAALQLTKDFCGEVIQFELCEEDINYATGMGFDNAPVKDVLHTLVSIDNNLSAKIKDDKFVIYSPSSKYPNCKDTIIFEEGATNKNYSSHKIRNSDELINSGKKISIQAKKGTSLTSILYNILYLSDLTNSLESYIDIYDYNIWLNRDINFTDEKAGTIIWFLTNGYFLEKDRYSKNIKIDLRPIKRGKYIDQPYYNITPEVFSEFEKLVHNNPRGLYKTTLIGERKWKKYPVGISDQCERLEMIKEMAKNDGITIEYGKCQSTPILNYYDNWQFSWQEIITPYLSYKNVIIRENNGKKYRLIYQD